MNVLDGATLTLSTPMVLDTVTMEEGAQLRSALTDVNQKVTAKVLRFAPKLSGNNWKALGVPFTSLEVKDSKGASVSAPSAQEADNGIWFADLKNNKTPIFEVKTDNFGAAGLWAAMAIPIRSLLKELLNSRPWKNLPLQLKQVLS